MKNRRLWGLPIHLIIICTPILLGGVVALILDIKAGNDNYLKMAGDFALILTFIVLVFYAYYTYSIAREAWTPCVSFDVYKTRPQYTLITFEIKNHSKVAVQCWCKLNASVIGGPVSLPGFFNGETSFDVQPFSKVEGEFTYVDLLSKAGKNQGDLSKSRTDDNAKKLFCMDVEFWYNKVGEKEKIVSPKQPYYFDFVRGELVADF